MVSECEWRERRLVVVGWLLLCCCFFFCVCTLCVVVVFFCFVFVFVVLVFVGCELFILFILVCFRHPTLRNLNFNTNSYIKGFCWRNLSFFLNDAVLRQTEDWPSTNPRIRVLTVLCSFHKSDFCAVRVHLDLVGDKDRMRLDLVGDKD